MSLFNLRTIFLCVLSIVGLLKFSEVINLEISDTILKDQMHRSTFI